MKRHIYDIYGELLHARSLAEQSDLKVNFLRGAHSERYDDDVPNKSERDTFKIVGDTLSIPLPSVTWGEYEWDCWWYAFYQLVGQVDRKVIDFHTDKELAVRKVEPGTLYHTLSHKLNEYRADKNRFGELAGRRAVLDAGKNSLNKKVRDNGTIPELSKDAGGEGEIAATMFAYDNYMRKGWQHLDETSDNYKELGEKGKEWFDKLVNGNYDVMLDGDISAQKLEEVLDKILSEVFEIDPEKQQEQDSAGGEGEPKDGDGSAKEGAEGEGEGSGDGKDSKGQGEVESGKGDGKSEGVDKILTLDPTNAKFKLQKNFTDIHDKLNPDDSNYTPYTPSDTLMVEFEKLSNKVSIKTLDNKEVDLESGSAFGYNVQEIKEYLLNEENWRKMNVEFDTSDALSRRLLKYLETHSNSTYAHNKEKGKLSSKSLYRLGFPTKGGRTLDTRVFKRKIKNSNLDSSISLLIDCSGSMSGNKYEVAGRTALLLNGLLRNLGVDYEIAGFTDVEWLVHYMLKPFDEANLSQERLHQRLGIAGGCMAGNADADSIMLAYRRLLARKCPRKIQIVVSDGRPSGYRGGLQRGTKEVVKRIQDDKRVEIYGIGIEDGSVKDYYKDYQIIKRLSEFEGAMLKLLKEKLS